jgi:hypothetical protein
VRVSDELIHSQSIQIESDKSSSEEVVLNWKQPLSDVLAKSHYEMKNEKAWASLCQSVRELCPETKWLSICESTKEDLTESIATFSSWITKLLATPEWPFPEQIILMMTASQEFKILFPKNTKLPYMIPFSNMTVTPWRDNHTSGWKVQKVKTFNGSKAGEA